MNTYIAFFKGQQKEVKASSSYQAQLEGAKLFNVKPNKSYTVTVMLAEKDGKEVVHTPNF